MEASGAVESLAPLGRLLDPVPPSLCVSLACLPACRPASHPRPPHPTPWPDHLAAQHSGLPPRTSSATVLSRHGGLQLSCTGAHSPALAACSSCQPPGWTPPTHHPPLVPHPHPSHSRLAVPASHRLLRHTRALSPPLPQISPSRTGAHVRAWHGAGEGALPPPPKPLQTPCPTVRPHSGPVPQAPHLPAPGIPPTHPGCPRPSPPSGILLALCPNPRGRPPT